MRFAKDISDIINKLWGHNIPRPTLKVKNNRWNSPCVLYGKINWSTLLYAQRNVRHNMTDVRNFIQTFFWQKIYIEYKFISYHQIKKKIIGAWRGGDPSKVYVNKRILSIRNIFLFPFRSTRRTVLGEKIISKLKISSGRLEQNRQK